MTYIFSKILSMSIEASFVILAVIAARFILKKSPKVFSYVLWAVVLFRLVCPFSPQVDLGFKINAPQISHSIENLLSVETSGNFSDEITRSEPHSTTQKVQNNHNEKADIAQQGEYTVESAKADFDTSDAKENYTNDEISSTRQPSTKSENFSDVLFYASIVWLIGVAAMAIYGIDSLIKIEEKLTSSKFLKENIYLCDNIPTAFVFGIVKPKIYIPSAVSERESELITLHEKYHIKRFDHLAKIAAFAVLCLHWFNPLVLLAFNLFSHDMEMSCDEAVTSKLDKNARAEYSSALLKLAVGGIKIKGLPTAFGEAGIKQRIKNVLNTKKSGVVKICLSCLVCAFILISCAVTPDTYTENLNHLDYQKQIPLAADSAGNINVVHYPQADGNDGVISLMKISGNEFSQFLSDLELKQAFKPQVTPSSECSVQVTLESLRFDIYKHKKLIKTTAGDVENWYVSKSNAYEQIVPLLFNNKAYVSEKCLFMHPLSSFYPFGGDSGCRYIIGSNFVRIVNRNGAITVFDGFNNEAWVKFPWDESSWKEFFVMTVSDIKMPDNFFEQAKYNALSDNMGLVKFGEEIWIIEFRENSQMGKYLWSIYSLISEPYKGEALWENQPYLSSKLAGFKFNFDFEFTELSATTVAGELSQTESASAAERGYNVILSDNSQSMYWFPALPQFDSPHYADTAEINLTVKDGDEQIYSGCIYITSEKSDGEQSRVYKATIVGTGLRIKQDEQFGGAIVFADENREHTEDREENFDVSIDFPIDQSLEDGENNLSSAVKAALYEKYTPHFPDGLVHKQAFEIIFSYSESGTPLVGQTNHINSHTVGMLVVNRVYSNYSGEISEVGGSSIPTVMRFCVDKDGIYSLEEYWEPRDGAYFAEDVKAKFKGDAYKLATTESQKIYNKLEEKVHAEAAEYFSSTGITIMEEIEMLLLKICSSPAHSSNPGDYILSHSREYEKLIGYDEFTLRYCFSEFLKGEQSDLRGHIMAITCREILKLYGEILVPHEGFMTGQDWFDAYYAAAYEAYENTPLIDFEKYYKGAYILIIIDGAK